jgi:sulfide:quinone oxidoreductase
MSTEQVTFELAPVYKKMGIMYHQAKAVSVHPEGKNGETSPFITIESTAPGSAGRIETVAYDFLINATGPKLNFNATPGLGPDQGNSLSICTFGHAAKAADQFKRAIDRMRKGEHLNFVIGTGHGLCTCQGAAFEYIFNVDFELRRHQVRDKASLIWISNEYELGDFGMGGMSICRGGYITSSKIFAESLYTEKAIQWISRAHVNKVEKDRVFYETLDGNQHFVKSDFTMLLPPFTGVGLKAFDRDGGDMTAKIFAPNGMMCVDADYSAKPFEEWSPEDWPKTYQSPYYKNIFAIGVAFAPPHPISKPMKSPNGVVIGPTPPRTGMPSAMMGKAVARSIAEMLRKNSDKPMHTASMAELGAACVASAGKSFFSGSAVSMTMYPIVPDYREYEKFGRSLTHTTGEVGLAGHWIKHFLHTMFLYKAKAKPFWWMIPE